MEFLIRASENYFNNVYKLILTAWDISTRKVGEISAEVELQTPVRLEGAVRRSWAT